MPTTTTKPIPTTTETKTNKMSGATTCGGWCADAGPRRYADPKTNPQYTRSHAEIHSIPPPPPFRYADAKTTPQLFRRNAVRRPSPDGKKAVARETEDITATTCSDAARKFSYAATTRSKIGSIVRKKEESEDAAIEEGGEEDAELEADLMAVIRRDTERLLRAEQREEKKSNSPVKAKLKASVRKVFAIRSR